MIPITGYSLETFAGILLCELNDYRDLSGHYKFFIFFLPSPLSLSFFHEKTTKFTTAMEIPVEFIEKNVKLRGRLHRISEQGLEIEHVPITLPIISSLQRRCK